MKDFKGLRGIAARSTEVPHEISDPSLVAGSDTVTGSDGITAGLPAQVLGYRQVNRQDA